MCWGEGVSPSYPLKRSHWDIPEIVALKLVGKLVGKTLVIHVTLLKSFKALDSVTQLYSLKPIYVALKLSSLEPTAQVINL